MPPLNLTCRRCSECSQSLHHWIELPVICPTKGPLCDYSCKHCDAAADACEACWGDGASEAGIRCDDCDGLGVIPITDEQRLRDIRTESDNWGGL